MVGDECQFTRHKDLLGLMWMTTQHLRIATLRVFIDNAWATATVINREVGDLSSEAATPLRLLAESCVSTLTFRFA